MLKIIRCILYGLAIVAGVAGLCIGGDPLVKYVWEMWRDAQSNDYYDIHYLNEPEMIVLLSLILLVAVRIAMALDKGIRPAAPPDSISEREKPAMLALTNDLAPRGVADQTTEPPVETADEKLTRLLKLKKD